MVIQLLLPNECACPAITHLQIKKTLDCKQVRVTCFPESEIAFPGIYVLKADGEVICSGILSFASEPDPLRMRILTISEQQPADNDPVPALINLTPYVFDQTIKFAEQRVPHRINITLQADWLQQCAGILDLGPNIATQFPMGMINSLNATFGECVHQTRKSGYTVMDSSFTQIAPPSTGILNVYPTLETVRVGQTSAQIKRYWFTCAWNIAWEYEQKRVEKLSFDLPFCPVGEYEESLHMKAEDVESLPGFNLSDATLRHLWADIVTQALNTIKETLCEKYCTTVSFSVPFHIAASLRLQQSVQFSYGAQTICGRVSSVNCILDEGSKEYAELSISVVPTWLNQWKNTHYTLKDLIDASPIEGLTEKELSEKTAIAEIAIENDAISQLEELASKNFAHMRDVDEFLDAHPTRIFIRLKDLRTKRHLAHTLVGSLKSDLLEQII
ncbi:MAG: hypothetical protein LBJ89_04355 [Holosporales bacterium]|jgi:hypothetical protein|nr:hypothetical protein [Holosporales bacterium]